MSKISCPVCGKEFLQATLDKYGGVCRKCKKEPVEESKTLRAPPPEPINTDLNLSGVNLPDNPLTPVDEEEDPVSDIETDREIAEEEEYAKVDTVQKLTPHDLLDITFPQKNRSVYQLIDILFNDKHGYTTGIVDEDRHKTPYDFLAKNFGTAVITNSEMRTTDHFTYYTFIGRRPNGSFCLFIRLTPEDQALVNWSEFV